MIDEKSAKEFERKYYADKKSVSAEDLFVLSKYYYCKREELSEKESKPVSNRFQETSPSSKRAVHLATQAYKKGAREREHLEFYKELLSKYKYKLSHNTYLMKVISSLRELNGVPEPTILQKVQGSDWIESGSLSLRDESFSEVFNTCDYYDLPQLIQNGKGVIFSTGGDGSVGLQIREVDGDIPALTDKEYKISPASTEEYTISVPTGKLIFSDMDFEGVRIDVKPGNYACKIYCIDIPEKFFGYYAVLCKTNKKARNEDARHETLEPGS